MKSITAADPVASVAIRGAATGFYRIKPLSANVCQLTYVVQSQLGGSIPLALLNLRVRNNLDDIYVVLDKFMRDGAKVDEELRAVFPVPLKLADLDNDQNELFGMGKKLVAKGFSGK